MLKQVVEMALQKAGIPCRLAGELIEYRAPDKRMRVADPRGGSKEISLPNSGGWTSCHILSVRDIQNRLLKNGVRIDVQEQLDILKAQGKIEDDRLRKEGLSPIGEDTVLTILKAQGKEDTVLPIGEDAVLTKEMLMRGIEHIRSKPLPEDGLLDIAGVVFNPEIHKVKNDGTPWMRQGKFIKG